MLTSDPGRKTIDRSEPPTDGASVPETGAFAAQFAALCTEGPEFREFDIVEVYGA